MNGMANGSGKFTRLIVWRLSPSAHGGHRSEKSAIFLFQCSPARLICILNMGTKSRVLVFCAGCAIIDYAFCLLSINLLLSIACIVCERVCLSHHNTPHNSISHQWLRNSNWNGFVLSLAGCCRTLRSICFHPFNVIFNLCQANLCQVEMLLPVLLRHEGIRSTIIYLN